MMTARQYGAPKDWLREFKKEHPLGDEFLREMDRQLGGALERATFEPASTFVLLPPESAGGSFPILRTSDGGTLRGDLLNVDTVREVEIRWRREGSALVFEWSKLPAEEIRDDLARRRQIAVHTEPPVPVEVRNPVWPDVRLLLTSDQDLEAAGAQSHLHSLVNAWNAGHESGGAIHNAGPLVRAGERLFAMKIDFGTAGVEALNYLLGGVVERYSIQKVILDC